MGKNDRTLTISMSSQLIIIKSNKKRAFRLKISRTKLRKIKVNLFQFQKQLAKESKTKLE